jgi:hypothetical protein
VGNQERKKNMAKNMTRKGLAVASAAALGITGLVAAPASAASALVLEDVNGYGNYKTISGETFTFVASGNADFVGDAAKLKVKVTNNDATEATDFAIRLDGEASVDVASTNQATLTDGSSGTDIELAADDASAVFALSAGDESDDTTGDGASIMTSPFEFSFTSAPDAESPASFDVTVFYDADNDGVVDAGELQTTQTVTFYDEADVAATVDLGAVQAGASSVDVEVSFPGFAVDQWTVVPTVDYEKKTLGALSDVDTENDLVLNDDEDGFTHTADLGDSAVEGSAIVATVFYDTTEVGTDASTVSALVADAVSFELAESTHTSSANDTALTDSAVTVTATVVDGDDDAAAGVSTSTTVTVDATLSDDVTFTLNGVTYTDNDDLADAMPLVLSTNSAGEVTFTAQGSGFANTDSIDFSLVAETLDAATYVVEYDDASYSLVPVNSQDTWYSMVDGGSVVTVWDVWDQFGGRPANNYDISIEYDDYDGFDTAPSSDSDSYASVVNGRASVTITPDSEGSGSAYYVAYLVERLPNGGYDSDIDDYGIDIYVADSSSELVAGDIAFVDEQNDTATVDADDESLWIADSTVAINGDDLGSSLYWADLNDAPTINNSLEFDLTVTTAATLDVAAASIEGAMVTLTSDSSVQFITDDNSFTGYNYSVGSTSIYTEEAGAVNFRVASNVAGTHTVVVTVGSYSESLEFEVDPAASTAGDSMTIEIKNAAPGQTMIVTGTLVDEYGNAVETDDTTDVDDLAVSYDGPGFIVGDLPSETDADGNWEFRVLLGSNDAVVGTVTATYDADGDTSDTTDSFSVQASLTTAAASAEVASWTKNLNDGTVKMYAKNIIGAGKVQFMLNGVEIAWVRAADATDPKLRTANGSYYLVRTVELVEGQKNVLEIWVDGVRTTRTAYTY